MQRIYDVTRWVKLDQGTRIEFPSEKPRRIRLEVNSPSEAQLYYVTADGEPIFLARCEGRDVIEYQCEGAHSIMADGGSDLFVYTADGEDVSMVVEAPVIFTKIVERRPRNIEIERMNYEMQANMQRLLAAQRSELDALNATRFAALEAQLTAARVAPGAAEQQPAAAGSASQATE